MGYWTEEGNYRFSKEEREIAKSNGVSAKLLFQRVNTGDWLPERAISTPPRKKAKYAEYAKIAAANGISPQAFSQRLNRQGWSMEEASTIPIGMYRGRKNVKCSKEDFERAAKNGISKSTFSNRVNQMGWSIEKAINQPLSYSRRKKSE